MIVKIDLFFAATHETLLIRGEPVIQSFQDGEVMPRKCPMDSFDGVAALQPNGWAAFRTRL